MKPWTYKSNISGDWHRCTIMLGDGSTVGGRMSLADARLIAAAPELLEACEIAYQSDDLSVKDILRAAIAKAKGEK